jgi:hypothetical protein
MARKKLRGDKTVGKTEKELGLPPGSIKNPNKRDARSDKTLKSLRKDYDK